MTVHCEQVSKDEKARILALVGKGEITIYKGASKLGIPYTTIVSRIYRGATVENAFLMPVQKRVSSNQKVGNAAWQALGDEAR